jgi:hypothetical protein
MEPEANTSRSFFENAAIVALECFTKKMGRPRDDPFFVQQLDEIYAVFASVRIGSRIDVTFDVRSFALTSFISFQS